MGVLGVDAGISRRSSVSDSDSDQDVGRGGMSGLQGLAGRPSFDSHNQQQQQQQLLRHGKAGGGGGDRGALDELSWLESARARTAEVLQERKKMKRRLGLAAQRFNTGSKGWLEYAQVSRTSVGQYTTLVPLPL